MIQYNIDLSICVCDIYEVCMLVSMQTKANKM